MIAASFWSLLAPAIELAESSGHYGHDGRYAFVPVAIGFLFGAIFVYATDKVITYLGINSASMMIQLTQPNKDKADIQIEECTMEQGKPMMPVGALNEHSMTIGMDSFADCLNNQHSGSTRKRRKNHSHASDQAIQDSEALDLQNKLTHWKRIILLITAITIHNIPGKFATAANLASLRNFINEHVTEGLAVGVSFGAIGSTSKATFEAARNLAIGIGKKYETYCIR
jgi:zinc transporter 11